MSRGIWQNRLQEKINKDDSNEIEKYVCAIWGHSIITLLQNVPNLDPPPHLFALLQFWQPPPPSNVQNLISASLPPPSPQIISSLNVFQVNPNTNRINY